MAVACTLLVTSAVARAEEDAETRSLNELRNTVVNLLQALVEKGVVTRDQAESLVKQAQTKAAADSAAAAKVAESEAGAVRVTHVPEMVKQEISTQVAQEVKPQVVSEVLATARNEKWGVPGALPEWLGRVKVEGDVRVREQYDAYASDNVQNTYLDFLNINDKGGIGRAGTAALLNTTEDRTRLRVRARLGVDVAVAEGWHAGLRLATGNLREPVSTNATLASTLGRYTVGLDRAYIRWDHKGSVDDPWLSISGGRMPNPWFSTDLLYDDDLSFDGIAGAFRLHLSDATPSQRYMFLTLGAFPLKEVELSGNDKWLTGAQLGLNWIFSGGSRLIFAGAIYDYENIVGIRNAPDSTLLDYTAPDFLQRGNTLFDIRNDTDPSTNLFALAADYTIVDVGATFELPFAESYKFAFSADYVHNIAFDEADVLARTGVPVEARVDGYKAEFALSRASYTVPGGWRAFVGYKYLERDAVLDALTDSDLRLGGTDVQGYYVGGDLGLAGNVWVRLRLLSGNEIDGPPFAVDVWQLDLNAAF
jgi:Putative porin